MVSLNEECTKNNKIYKYNLERATSLIIIVMSSWNIILSASYKFTADGVSMQLKVIVLEKDLVN